MRDLSKMLEEIKKRKKELLDKAKKCEQIGDLRGVMFYKSLVEDLTKIQADFERLQPAKKLVSSIEKENKKIFRKVSASILKFQKRCKRFESDEEERVSLLTRLREELEMNISTVSFCGEDLKPREETATKFYEEEKAALMARLKKDEITV